ncbi:trans-aconitate 2-methyltransferase [Aliiruegeria haliotis]|uniref:Trans-aconitate 2-methyltransferase n=1 Tax=Aliiruegeria haliotis TaxID=1280846 RepID=A0A2T0RNH6_9RHOB|nr:methyltransferase domain-containing protein [Aliiruegeria haliotis]PRY22663.1 trans-aconitate 2-methyltransferase [Aliiruegeria haliotis]
MSETLSNDWNPETYLRFRGLRLQPALDLIGRVGHLPGRGAVVDLGCGTGVVGPVLRERFAGRKVIGVDLSPAMLAQAEAMGIYDHLAQVDAAEWQSEAPPALLFSNAALQWLGDHETLFPRLVGQLASGGVLAVQMPRQTDGPSHVLLRQVAAALFPERFADAAPKPAVLEPAAYFDLLSPFGAVTIWETIYQQHLQPAADGHPVRAFTRATVARPILERLNEEETGRFLAAYDEALAVSYPLRPDGTVIFPFRRLFMVLETG